MQKQESKKVIVGIDVSKKHLDVAVRAHGRVISSQQ